MEIASPFARLNTIMDLLRHHPSRQKVLEHLSEFACPEGEIAGVTTSFLDEHGIINLELTVGFSLDLTQDSKIKITDNHPRAATLRSMQISYLDISRKLDGAKLATYINNLSDYKTAVGIPATPTRLYGLAFTRSIAFVEKNRDYFECLRSILSLWEMMNEKTILKSGEKYELKDRALTERQRKIVLFIQQGGTNLSIGVALGYSESLIRQETIIIYKKLGVSGRKELLEKNLSNS